MKLPNGYGTVYKLSGNRRRPYIARQSSGFDEKGTQKYQTIGYYKTKSDALRALADYNDNPFDLNMSQCTFEEMYHKWFADTFDENSNRSTVKNYETAYKYCKPILQMKISDIRPIDMQAIIDNCRRGYQTTSRIKILMNKVLEWCVQKEYIKKNYAKNLKVHMDRPETTRTAFSREDINTFWSLADTNPNIRIVLMLIYSGVRIQELLNLRKEDVDIEKQYFKVRASKTSAGIRIVPIADKVLPFWEDYMKESKCEYVICTPEGEQMTYDNYRKRYWHPLMEKLNMHYTIHETRHTCNSLLIMSDCNPTIRKKIMGHKSQMDIGEAVYGHIYVEELVKAINKI